MDQNRRRRRGKRDREPRKNNDNGPEPSQIDVKADPDHDLIHPSPPTQTQRESRRSETTMSQHQRHAFASIDPSQYREKRQYAGTSSAAASIVLELPTMKPKPTKKQQSSALDLMNGNRKRFSPVTTREVQKWRNSTGKSCYRFKPVYTHQFFTDEQVEGHRPTDAAINEAQSVVSPESDGASHPSFSHHDIAGHTLSVQVRLAPSCRRSVMLLEIGRDLNSGSGKSSSAVVLCQPAKRETALRKSQKKTPPVVQTSGETLDGGKVKHTCPKCSREFIYTTKRTAAASFSNHARNCKGGQEENQKVAVTKTEGAADAPLVRKVSSESTLSDGVSWDGDEEDNDGEFELKDNRGGRKRVRRGSSGGGGGGPQKKKSTGGRQRKKNDGAARSITPQVSFDGDGIVAAVPSNDCVVGLESSPVGGMKSGDGNPTPRKRGRGRPPKKERGRKSPSVMPTSASSSSRRRGKKSKRLQAVDSLFTIGEPDVNAPGGKIVQPPRQSKRPPRQVTDVSDSPSSDEEMTDLLTSLTTSGARKTGSPPRTSCDNCHSKHKRCDGTHPRCSFHSNAAASPYEPSTISSSTATLLEKMKVGTIVTQVAAGLPQVSAILVKDGSVPDDGGASYKVLHASTSSTVDVENDYLEQPIGTVIREYSLEKTSMSLSTSGGISYPSSTKGTRGDFVMTLADMRTDWEARRYHDEVEKISHWFIEIASCVEVGQTGGIEADGGYWKVLYLFEKHRIGGAPKYSFVGYVTLYYHGQTMTVCQAVCLPPYQRSGHGTEMLMTAYDCNDSREILVESPAPAFVALRNRIDYSLVSELIERTQIIPQSFTQPTIQDTPLPDEIIAKAASNLCITPRQVATAFDIWRLGELEKSIRNAAASGSLSISSMEANYKSVVKRTLLKALREDRELNFDSMDRGEQIEHLERCFNATIVRYRSILK